MRFKLTREPKIKLKYHPGEQLLAAVYPRMYCPRCGSVDIELRRLTKSGAIWECGDCDANFRLIFPKATRF